MSDAAGRAERRLAHPAGGRRPPPLPRDLGVPACCVLVIAVATIKTPGFLFSGDGWRNLLVTPSLLVLLAVGQAVVIITRNVDLSVGSILALTAYLTGRLFVDHPGLPIVAVVAARDPRRRPARPGQRRAGRLRQGARAGDHAGHALHLPGHRPHLGRQRPDQRRRHARRLPRARHPLGPEHPGPDDRRGRRPRRRRLLHVHRPRRPRALRDRLRPGRRRAVRPAGPASGASARSCSAARWPASPASLFAARYGTVSSSAGLGIELQAVAAAVIGGVAIFGGSGTVWGAALGAMLLVTINRALPIIGIQDFWQRAVVGVLILGAIVLDRVLSAPPGTRLAEAREAS